MQESFHPHSTLGDRIVIGVISAPVAAICGWGFALMTFKGIGPGGGWLTWAVRAVLSEFLGALFFIFLFALLWAVTGNEYFDQLIFRRIGRASLAVFVFTTAMILLSLLF